MDRYLKKLFQEITKAAQARVVAPLDSCQKFETYFSQSTFDNHCSTITDLDQFSQAATWVTLSVLSHTAAGTADPTLQNKFTSFISRFINYLTGQRVWQSLLVVYLDLSEHFLRYEKFDRAKKYYDDAVRLSVDKNMTNEINARQLQMQLDNFALFTFWQYGFYRQTLAAITVFLNDLEQPPVNSCTWEWAHSKLLSSFEDTWPWILQVGLAKPLDHAAEYSPGHGVTGRQAMNVPLHFPWLNPIRETIEKYLDVVNRCSQPMAEYLKNALSGPIQHDAIATSFEAWSLEPDGGCAFKKHLQQAMELIDYCLSANQYEAAKCYYCAIKEIIEDDHQQRLRAALARQTQADLLSTNSLYGLLSKLAEHNPLYPEVLYNQPLRQIDSHLYLRVPRSAAPRRFLTDGARRLLENSVPKYLQRKREILEAQTQLHDALVDRPESILQAQQHYTNKVSSIIRDIVRESVAGLQSKLAYAALLQRYCFDVVLLGSAAQQRLSFGSDIDLALWWESAITTAEMLELKVVGETVHSTVGDLAQRFQTDLFRILERQFQLMGMPFLLDGTTKEMWSTGFHTMVSWREIFKADPHLRIQPSEYESCFPKVLFKHSLKTASVEERAEQQPQIQSIQRQKVALACFQRHQQEFLEHGETVRKPEFPLPGARAPQDLKNGLLRPLIFWCQTVALYHDIIDSETGMWQADPVIILGALGKTSPPLFSYSLLDQVEGLLRQLSKIRLNIHWRQIRDKLKAADPETQDWLDESEQTHLAPFYWHDLVALYQEVISMFRRCLGQGCWQANFNPIESYWHHPMTRAGVRRITMLADIEWSQMLSGAVSPVNAPLPDRPTVILPTGQRGQLSPLVQESLLKQTDDGSWAFLPRLSSQRTGIHTVLPVRVGQLPPLRPPDEQSMPSFHAKLWPEFPLMSQAVQCLVVRLVGEGAVPRSQMVVVTLPTSARNNPFKQVVVEWVENVPGSSLTAHIDRQQRLASGDPAELVATIDDKIPEAMQQDVLSHISAKSWTQQFILSLLLELEDESDQNVMLRPVKDGGGNLKEWDLVKIDIERAFFSQPGMTSDRLKTLNPTKLVNKSILFCLPLMDRVDVLDHGVLAQFAHLDLLPLLQAWLDELVALHARSLKQCDNKLLDSITPPLSTTGNTQSWRFWETGDGFDEKSFVPIYLAETVIESLYERLQRLQDVLKPLLVEFQVDDPSAEITFNGWTLLRRLSPDLYAYYQWAVKQAYPAITDPLLLAKARFDTLTPDSYRRDAADRIVTTKRSAAVAFHHVQPSTVLTEPLSIREEEPARTVVSVPTQPPRTLRNLVETILTGKFGSPQYAKAMLNIIATIDADPQWADTVWSRLVRGDSRQFSHLSPLRKAQLLKQFEAHFTKGPLDRDVQLRVLQNLYGVPLQSITLTVFRDRLNDDRLKLLLRQHGHHLIYLDMTDCYRLTSASLVTFGDYCPNLKCLILDKTAVTVVRPTSSLFGVNVQWRWLHLTRLSLKGCQNLTDILLDSDEAMPQLCHLDIAGCSQLSRLMINSAALSIITGIETCHALSGKTLLKRYPFFVALPIHKLSDSQSFYATVTPILRPLDCLDADLVQLPIEHKRVVLSGFQRWFELQTQYKIDLSQRRKHVADSHSLSLSLPLPRNGFQLVTAGCSQYGVKNDMKVEQPAATPNHHRTSISVVDVDSLLARCQCADLNIRCSIYQELGKVAIPSERQMAVTTALLEACRCDDLDVRNAAISTLGEIVIPTDQQVDVVARLLEICESTELCITKTAISTLAKVAIPNEQQADVVDTLLSYCGDGDLYIRRSAIWALGRVVIPMERQMAVVAGLLSCRGDIEPEIRGSTVQTLGQVAIPNEQQTVVVDILLGLCSDINLSVRTLAVDALSQVMIPMVQQEAVVITLLTHCRDEDLSVRKAAIRALAHVVIPKSQQTNVVDNLLICQSDTDASIRQSVIELLKQVEIINEQQGAVLDALLERCNDKYSHVCLSAVSTLSNVVIPRDRQAAVVEALLHYLDKDPIIKVPVIQALCQVKIPDQHQQRVVNTLLACCRERNKEICARSAEALGHVVNTCEHQVALISTLIKCSKHRESSIRLSVAQALFQVSISAKHDELMTDVVRTLHKMLEDSDADTRITAAKALDYQLSLQAWAQRIQTYIKRQHALPPTSLTLSSQASSESSSASSRYRFFSPKQGLTDRQLTQRAVRTQLTGLRSTPIPPLMSTRMTGYFKDARESCHLDLADQQLTTEDVVIITAELCNFSNLLSLDLSCNQLDDICITSLLEALPNCQLLKSLKLNKVGLSTQHIFQIQELISALPQLQYLDIRFNSLPEVLILSLIRAINDTAGALYHLRVGGNWATDRTLTVLLDLFSNTKASIFTVDNEFHDPKIDLSDLDNRYFQFSNGSRAALNDVIKRRLSMPSSSIEPHGLGAVNTSSRRAAAEDQAVATTARMHPTG